MKSKVAALMMAMAVLVLAVTASLAGKVLFEDKFTSLDPSWGAPGPIMDAKAGKLLITPEVNTSQTVLNQGNVFPNDAEGSFAMTFVKAPAPTWGSGLVFWAKDYNEYYAVLINSDGWFAVQRYIAGRYLLPVAWRESDAIKKGEGVENQVKVVTKANKATVLINGKEVISLSGQPPQGGALIGFKVASGPEGSNAVAFSNFQLVQP
ncbi:MAG: hypothetical protein FJ121_03150 [Deltaproteobacteria bacterium]|nr:hypothetical protein [Deltaproteobacteria bacterium]